MTGELKDFLRASLYSNSGCPSLRKLVPPQHLPQSNFIHANRQINMHEVLLWEICKTDFSTSLRLF